MAINITRITLLSEHQLALNSYAQVLDVVGDLAPYTCEDINTGETSTFHKYVKLAYCVIPDMNINRITLETEENLHKQSYVEITEETGPLRPVTQENIVTGQTTEHSKYAQIVYISNLEDLANVDVTAMENRLANQQPMLQNATHLFFYGISPDGSGDWVINRWNIATGEKDCRSGASGTEPTYDLATFEALFI